MTRADGGERVDRVVVALDEDPDDARAKFLSLLALDEHAELATSPGERASSPERRIVRRA